MIIRIFLQITFGNRVLQFSGEFGTANVEQLIEFAFEFLFAFSGEVCVMSHVLSYSEYEAFSGSKGYWHGIKLQLDEFSPLARQGQNVLAMQLLNRTIEQIRLFPQLSTVMESRGFFGRIGTQRVIYCLPQFVEIFNIGRNLFFHLTPQNDFAVSLNNILIIPIPQTV